MSLGQTEETYMFWLYKTNYWSTRNRIVNKKDNNFKTPKLSKCEIKTLCTGTHATLSWEGQDRFNQIKASNVEATVDQKNHSWKPISGQVQAVKIKESTKRLGNRLHANSEIKIHNLDKPT